MLILFKGISWATRIPPPSPFVGLRYAPASSRTGRGDDPRPLRGEEDSWFANYRISPGLLAPRQEKSPELYGKVGAGELTLSEAQKTATRRESQPEAGAEKQIPAVRCQIEGLVTRIHRLLESTPDKKQAYEALQPLLQWAKTFEEQQGEEQAAPAGGPESRLPLLKAANA